MSKVEPLNATVAEEIENTRVLREFVNPTVRGKKVLAYACGLTLLYFTGLYLLLGNIDQWVSHVMK